MVILIVFNLLEVLSMVAEMILEYHAIILVEFIDINIHVLPRIGVALAGILVMILVIILVGIGLMDTMIVILLIVMHIHAILMLVHAVHVLTITLQFVKIVITDAINVLVQAGPLNVHHVEMDMYYGLDLHGNPTIHADNIVQKHHIKLMEILFLDNIILVLVVYAQIVQLDALGVEIVQIITNAICVVMTII